MEYLLLAGVTLLIGCCVVALVLEPPTRIGQRSSAGPQTGSWVRRTDQSRRSRRGRTTITPSGPSAAPVSSGPERLPPALSARREAIPLDCHGDSAMDDAPPYSPQELRNLLERRPPASPRAS